MRNSLIIHLLGKKISLWNMQYKLQRIWKTREKYSLRDIDNGYFVVSFSCEEDLNYVYLEGAWMIVDHYLMAQ